MPGTEPEKGTEAMTLEELKAKHPELFKEAFELGVISMDLLKLQAESKQLGITEERERVTKLLAEKADSEVTAKAITDGMTVEAAGWEFYRAEKENRTKKLEDVATARPDSAGHGAKPAGNGSGTGKDFVALRDAYAKEHKCGLGTATKEIVNQYPDIHQAWLSGQVQ